MRLLPARNIVSFKVVELEKSTENRMSITKNEIEITYLNIYLLKLYYYHWAELTPIHFPEDRHDERRDDVLLKGCS